MQAARNLSDAWLAHWIENINSTTVTPIQPNSSLQLDMKSQAKNIIKHATCFLQKIIVFGNFDDCLENNSSNLAQENIETQNSYYLAIYIAIAIFNSIIALVRAFAFAYAGIKAAKFMHNRLLNSVIYVSRKIVVKCVHNIISIFLFFYFYICFF